MYEDDITFIPSAIQMSFQELMKFIFNYVTNLYGHGRPLSDSFIHLFSWLGWRLGGLRMIYVFGYVIVLGNAVAFYLLIRRIHGQILALTAGTFFVLYSADTTQAYLTHSLGLFPSMLFLLVGFHAYLSRRQLLSYLFLALALLTYETTYFVFLVAPLLSTTSWGKDKSLEMVRHALFVAVMFLAVYFIRSRLGDDRIADVQGWALILTPIRHMIIGPLVSISSYFLRTFQALQSLTSMQVLWVVLAAISGFILFQRTRFTQAPIPVSIFPKPSTATGKRATLFNLIKLKWSEVSPETRHWIMLLATALLMVVLAYPLTYTTRSFSISGRATRVHFAAGPGVALFWGVVFNAALFARRGSLVRLFGLNLFVVILPLMVVFGFKIQDDYKLAWERQQDFWSELIPIIPHVKDGMAILVLPDVFRDIEQIDANTWNLPRILPQLFQFPEEWENPPMVYRLVQNWESMIVTPDGKFDLFNLTVNAPPSTYREVEPSMTSIIGRGKSGRMERRSQVLIGGTPYALLGEEGIGLSKYGHGLLYSLLSLGSGELQ